MDTNTNTNVKLANVRLSFPSLFSARKFAPTDAKGSFSAALILDKKVNAREIAAVKAAIASVVATDFKGKAPAKTCLRDGAEKSDTDGYGDGVMFISARSDKRPQVVGRDLAPLTEEDGKPYAGCYINATIQVWGQDNQYGKRINAKLRCVQFYKDGATFGEAPINIEQEFSVISDDNVL